MSDGDEPQQKRVGRPPYEPTEDERFLVSVLHTHGISHQVIAGYVNRNGGGIHPKTLRKVFRQELKQARERVKSAMIAAIVRAGVQGNVTAAKYWLSLFGGDEFRPARFDDDLPASPIDPGTGIDQSGGMTIKIIGGLPVVPVQTIDETGEEVDETPPPSGKGNGTTPH